MNSPIIVSVITINLNNAKGLQKTIASVQSQSYKHIEYLIIDGASTDGSLDVVASFESNNLHLLSKKDTGIYNAMNKGIALAKGEYLLFLNSGDTFYNQNSLEKLVLASNQIDLVYGNIIVAYPTQSIVKQYPQELTFGYFINDSLPHPATLIRKSLFTQLGMYNEQNKIVSDWEFMMNAICLHKCSYKYLPETISVFDVNGLSSNPNYKVLQQKERLAALNRHYKLFLPDYQQASISQKQLLIYKTSRLHQWVEKLRAIIN
jgi:glycosyltransferase involved in cell wall biosynthesis